MVKLSNLEKINVEKACLVFGAFDTAKKLRDSPDKLDFLMDYLLDKQMKKASYIIQQHYL